MFTKNVCVYGNSCIQKSIWRLMHLWKNTFLFCLYFPPGWSCKVPGEIIRSSLLFSLFIFCFSVPHFYSPFFYLVISLFKPLLSHYFDPIMSLHNMGQTPLDEKGDFLPTSVPKIRMQVGCWLVFTWSGSVLTQKQWPETGIEVTLPRWDATPVATRENVEKMRFPCIRDSQFWMEKDFSQGNLAKETNR